MPSKKTRICLKKMDSGIIIQTWLTSKYQYICACKRCIPFIVDLMSQLHYLSYFIVFEINPLTQLTSKELPGHSDLIMVSKSHHPSQQWTMLKEPIMIILWWPEKVLSIKLVEERIPNKQELLGKYHLSMVMPQRVNWYIKEVWTQSPKNLILAQWGGCNKELVHTLIMAIRNRN